MQKLANHFSFSVVCLAVVPKSNAVHQAFNKAQGFVKKDGTCAVPLNVHNAPIQLMKELDYGGYGRVAHDGEGGFAAVENYFPEGMHQQVGADL